MTEVNEEIATESNKDLNGEGSDPKDKTPRSDNNKMNGINEKLWYEKKLKLVHKDFHKAREGIVAEEPSLKEYTPYTWNSLLSYTTTDVVDFACHKATGETPHGYVQRRTAMNIVDPELSWKMDNVLYLSDQMAVNQVLENEEEEKETTRREKNMNNSNSQIQKSSENLEDKNKSKMHDETGGVESKRDPKGQEESRAPEKGEGGKGKKDVPEDHKFYVNPRFKILKVNRLAVQKTEKYREEGLNYGDVAAIREEMSSRYSAAAKAKQITDYKITKKDWMDMGLDRLGELHHPLLRETAYTTSLAYLGAKPGSRRAALDKTKEVLADVFEEMDGSSKKPYEKHVQAA